jgi:hypothetical protein
MVRDLTKRVLEHLAQVVSKNELFEQPGDRPRQPVLAEDAWKGAEAEEQEVSD